MLVIPTLAVPSQTLTVALAGQRCALALYERRDYTVPYGGAARPPGGVDYPPALYLDLLLNDAPVVLGVLCLQGVLLVRDAYLGFIGDLAFFDLQGTVNPFGDGLGTRFYLAFLEPGIDV